MATQELKGLSWDSATDSVVVTDWDKTSLHLTCYLKQEGNEESVTEHTWNLIGEDEIPDILDSDSIIDIEGYGYEDTPVYELSVASHFYLDWYINRLVFNQGVKMLVEKDPNMKRVLLYLDRRLVEGSMGLRETSIAENLEPEDYNINVISAESGSHWLISVEGLR